MKLQVDKIELQTMMREFWDVRNNETCLGVTIIFLRHCGIENKEILHWLKEHNSDYIRNTTEQDFENFDTAVESTKDYYAFVEVDE